MADDGGAHAPSFARRLRDAVSDGDALSQLDVEVDALLPEWARDLSRVHWTPVAVATTAAVFLAGERGEAARIMDIGAGVGKFAVVAAATTGSQCIGIEQSARLVRVASMLAAQLGVSSAKFRRVNMARVGWKSAHGLYFFNPFAESFLDDGLLVDANATRRGWPTYVDNVRTALAKLYLMPFGTRVATFHGLGAEMPPGYEQVDAMPFPGGGMLRCYVRRSSRHVVRRFPHDFHSHPGLFDRRLDAPDPAAPAVATPAQTVSDPLSELAVQTKGRKQTRLSEP